MSSSQRVYLSRPPTPTATPKTRQFAFGALISDATFYARMTRGRGGGKGRACACVKRLHEYRVGIRTSEALPRSVMQTDVYSLPGAKR
jgi:hypothetical protein